MIIGYYTRILRTELLFPKFQQNLIIKINNLFVLRIGVCCYPRTLLNYCFNIYYYFDIFRHHKYVIHTTVYAILSHHSFIIRIYKCDRKYWFTVLYKGKPPSLQIELLESLPSQPRRMTLQLSSLPVHSAVD